MDAVEQFQTELDALLNRWIEESDMSLAEVVGTLEIVKQELLNRSLGDDESEEEAAP